MLNKKITFIGGISVLLLAYYFSNKINYHSNKKGKTVETKSGKVRGIISVSRDGREFYEWLGIPYAKPPQGILRFASPQPIEKWHKVLDASSYGSPCAQLDVFTGKLAGEENCLFLNVHIPKKINDAKRLLPVMFWIFGGYFMSGSGDMYRPDFFMDEDVLVVTFNYRVGALGFLNTGDAEVRGNMGLKDQYMALKWVNENIAYFGGDPKRITIFGESAGAASVHYHMLSPKSKGFMQRAISQSGSALNVWALGEDPSGQAKRYAEKFDCPTVSSLMMVDCLRQIEINDLLEVHKEFLHPTRKQSMAFVPTVENIVDEETFLAEHPMNLIKSGRGAKIPYLIGFNKDEALFFGNSFRTDKEFRHNLENDRNVLAEVGLSLNKTERQFLERIIEFYFGKEKKMDLVQDYSTATKLNTDRWFAYGIYKTATLHSQWSPVQFYYYNKTGPSIYDFMLMIHGNFPPTVEILFGLTVNWFNSNVLGKPPVSHGVCHVDDLAMLFEMVGLFNVRQGHSHYEFSKDLVKTWASFASLPNVADVEFRGEKFPILDPNGEVKVLEINDIPEAKMLPTKDRMEFWESLYI